MSFNPFQAFQSLSLAYETVKKFETNFDAVMKSSVALNAQAIVEASRPNLSVLESAVTRLQLDSTKTALLNTDAILAANNRQFAALESFVDRLQLSPKSVQAFVASADAAHKLSGSSRVVDAWRSMFDKSNALVNADAINSAMASLRLSPQFAGFPQFDFSAVEPSRRPSVKAGVDTLEQSVRAVANKPTASEQDAEDILVTIHNVSNAHPENSLYYKLFGLQLLYWLLNVFAEDPVKQATFRVLTHLFLIVASFSPAQLPSVPPSEVSSLSAATKGNWQVAGLPELIKKAGPAAEASALRFLNEVVQNRNTRRAYTGAIVQFMNWCDDRQLSLVEISEISVTAFVQERTNESRPTTARLQLAAIRRLFDQFVVDGILLSNPASRVRVPPSAPAEAPKLQPEPILVRQLIDVIDITRPSGLRDAAIFNLMVYGFAPASAIVSMDIGDYFLANGSHWIRLKNRQGQFYIVPAHHRVSASIDAYIQMLAVTNAAHSPLWRSATKRGEIGSRRLSRTDVFRITQRRASDVGFAGRVSPRTLRSAGLNAFLRNGGSLQSAQALTSQKTVAIETPVLGSTGTNSHADIERIAI